MSATWQKPLAKGVTAWNGLSAGLSLPTNKLFYGVVTTGAISHSRGVFLTGQTCTGMTRLIARVGTTIKLLTTRCFARELASTANEILGFATTVTSLFFFLFARGTRAFVTFVFAFMISTVERLSTLVFAREF